MSGNSSNTDKYKIFIQNNLLRHLEDIKRNNINIFDQIGLAINKLKENPQRNKLLKGKGKKNRSARAGDYRIIYQIHGKNVRIIDIAHRKSVYKNIKKK